MVHSGEIFKGTNMSAQTTLEQVESFASSGGIELKGEGEDISNSKITNEEVSNIYSWCAENPSSVMKNWGSHELSEGKNKSLQVETPVRNSSASESSVRREESGILSSVNKNKGTSK
ncbi:hypothetical protein SASPL_148650 [Salvia splendens]|uniref:Uncharacterized protein n=1 Tax=Salvia splendens TaxID=180675 RepID=A0A8X8WA84_SALSN|nr:hypothetical protein SASPL_148650 [Salvia splendens]